MKFLGVKRNLLAEFDEVADFPNFETSSSKDLLKNVLSVESLLSNSFKKMKIYNSPTEYN